jgi:hypothetical protein
MPRAAIRDLVVAVSGFAITFSLIFVMGRVFIPSFGATIGDVDIAATGGSPLLDLRTDLAALHPPAAVLEATGALEGRFVLDRTVFVSRFGRPRNIVNVGKDVPVDIDVKFSAGGLILTLVAEQVPVGEPRRDRMTVVVTADGQTFSAQPGSCAIELFESGVLTRNTGLGQAISPSYSGQVTCTDVAEIRSGALVSFTAVFVYE